VDRLGLTTSVVGALDASRADLSVERVAAAARSLIAAMVASLSAEDDDRDREDELSLASRLWRGLTSSPPSTCASYVLNAYMVLLADHDLTTSNLAARVAASTRADPYSAVAAALATFNGPLHSTFSESVVALLRNAYGPAGPKVAVERHLRYARQQTSTSTPGAPGFGHRVPGFGHPIYAGGDPRGAAMLELLSLLPGEAEPNFAERQRLVCEVLEEASAYSDSPPNSDFGLGALAFVTRMRADAGEAIFAIARTAGWIAHTLEEYQEAPSRFRKRALYTGIRHERDTLEPTKPTGALIASVGRRQHSFGS
jgi:citrate synthase